MIIFKSLFQCKLILYDIVHKLFSILLHVLENKMAGSWIWLMKTDHCQSGVFWWMCGWNVNTFSGHLSGRKKSEVICQYQGHKQCYIIHTVNGFLSVSIIWHPKQNTGQNWTNFSSDMCKNGKAHNQLIYYGELSSISGLIIETGSLWWTQMSWWLPSSPEHGHRSNFWNTLFRIWGKEQKSTRSEIPRYISRELLSYSIPLSYCLTVIRDW
jgi:hypothetical protein